MTRLTLGGAVPLALLCAACGSSDANRATKVAAQTRELATCLAPLGTLIAPDRRHTMQFPTPPSDDPSNIADLGIESLAILKLGGGADLHIVRTYGRADARFVARWGEGGTPAE